MARRVVDMCQKILHINVLCYIVCFGPHHFSQSSGCCVITFVPTVFWGQHSGRTLCFLPFFIIFILVVAPCALVVYKVAWCTVVTNVMSSVPVILYSTIHVKKGTIFPMYLRYIFRPVALVARRRLLIQ